MAYVSHLQHIVGPLGDDPLTPDELSILLALPRAAQKTPHALFVRLPKGATAGDGHYDVSFAQAAAIVGRLASALKTRTDIQLGPGITVCLMIDPYVHGFFHQLAFWALGCTVQYVTGVFGEEMVDGQLKQAGCKLTVYLGKTKERVEARRDKHGIEMFELEESEYAGALVRQELAGLGPAPEWPTPKRPSPAVVIQSSSTTAMPKVLGFDLHFYALSIPHNSRRHLDSRPPSEFGSTKRPDTHPVLIASDPFWQPFHEHLLVHLVTATPFALTFPLRSLSVDDFAGWLKELDSMYSITLVGCGIQDQLSELMSEKRIVAHNLFGNSELSKLMTADRAPYNHLRPIPDFPPPLAVPALAWSVQSGIAKTNPNREVTLWYIVSRYPPLAHVMLRGRVPLKLEPFPGPGPYKGQPAMNLGDVFYEIITKEGEEKDVAYAHAARLDDYLRLNNDMDIVEDD
ncbi:AMP binding enzyme [Ceratobasidium sp. AG-Ba]|nr:AMP binding enzyme [Ceratobasidium sp. AG-Ba]